MSNKEPDLDQMHRILLLLHERRIANGSSFLSRKHEVGHMELVEHFAPTKMLQSPLSPELGALLFRGLIQYGLDMGPLQGTTYHITDIGVHAVVEQKLLKEQLANVHARWKRCLGYIAVGVSIAALALSVWQEVRSYSSGEQLDQLEQRVLQLEAAAVRPPGG